MAEIREGGASFIGYEYLELPEKGAYTSLCLDCYPSFGWVPDERSLEDSGKKSGTIVLKRDRKILNKMELTRLQRHFEACLADLEELERSKTANARVYSIGLGLIGCVFLALATFAATAEPMRLTETVLWAVPGFACWIFPHFLYRTLVRRRSVTVRELKEQKYDEIYEICQKGNTLLP